MIRVYTLKKDLIESEQSMINVAIHHKAILDKGILIHDDDVYHEGLSKISTWKEATTTEATQYLAQAEVKLPARDLAAELDTAKADIVKLKAGKVDKV